ncbi:MAG: DUF4013 domain-containing protein [Methanobacteriota archaeon]
MRIGNNLSNSFGFAQDALLGKWVRWIMLVISSIVFPVMYGYTVKVMRGIEPAYEEESFFTLFIDGIKLCVINVVYMIVPIVVFAATIGYAIFGIISAGGNFSVQSILPILGGLIGGIILTIILGFIFMLLSIIGSVRFARTDSLGEAFAIGEIVSTIGKIGWVNYIFSLIALFIAVFFIVFIIMVIEIVLAFIPILGWIIGWIISLFLGPFLSLMTSRYYSLLYDEGV